MAKLPMFTLTLCGLLLATSARCDIGSDLSDHLDGLGFSSNVTNASAYQSQAAGSFGSGSLVSRTSVRVFRLIQLDLPSFKTGCAGIDLYTGSLSFLKGDRLKELGKAVMSNAGAYAFDVALATSIPQLKVVKDNLQNLQQKINQASINSCQTAQSLVGGIWPKTQASQEKICHDQGTMGNNGLFSDIVTARMGCAGKGKKGDEYQASLEAAKEDGRYKDKVLYGKNIVWSLLKQRSSLGSDRQLMELAMSLTGTIIIDRKGHVTEIPALSNSQSIIDGLIGHDDGSDVTIKIWRCKDNDSDCLTMTQQDITISHDKSLQAKINALIDGMYQNLKTNQPLDGAQKNLLSKTHIPIFKFVSVLASTEYGIRAVDLHDYSSLIANDILAHYLSELIEEVKGVSANAQLNEDMILSLEKRVNSAQAMVANINPTVGRKLDEKLKLITRIAQLEKQLVVDMQSKGEF